MIQRVLDFFEKQAFGVLTRYANKIGVSVSSVRVLFIYASFITLGSPLVIYFIMLFFLRLKDSFYNKKRSIFEI
jgi:phage shock protein PspC (stress-responsive transcriptional regulator)